MTMEQSAAQKDSKKSTCELFLFSSFEDYLR
jgi:hypothetical protein